MNANLEGVSITPEAKKGKKNDANSAEHIGQTLLSVESKREHLSKIGLDRLIKESSKPEKPSRPNTAKNPMTMSRAELMQLSETIMIDGSSLRQIYETHLIGERGLRNILAEAMKGGDLRKALKTEVIEREMDFERDPALRSVLPAQIEGSASNEQLEDLLNKAAKSVDQSSEEAAFFRAQAKYHASKGVNSTKQRRKIDFAIGAVIASLLFIILILFLMRS